MDLDIETYLKIFMMSYINAIVYPAEKAVRFFNRSNEQLDEMFLSDVRKLKKSYMSKDINEYGVSICFMTI